MANVHQIIIINIRETEKKRKEEWTVVERETRKGKIEFRIIFVVESVSEMREREWRNGFLFLHVINYLNTVNYGFPVIVT